MWPLEANSAAWSAVGRPANGQFLTVMAAVDRPVDRGLDIESSSSLPVDRPVDRGHFQRAELSGGRPGRSTGPLAKQSLGRPPSRPRPFLESRALWWSTRSIDRPSSQTSHARFVHVGRPPGRPTSGSVDRAVDR